jgi:membrane protein implicated in regulation of membrane protease activity
MLNKALLPFVSLATIIGAAITCAVYWSTVVAMPWPLILWCSAAVICTTVAILSYLQRHEREREEKKREAAAKREKEITASFDALSDAVWSVMHPHNTLPKEWNDIAISLGRHRVALGIAPRTERT